MIKTLLQHPMALFYSIMVHVVLVAVMVVSFDWSADDDLKINVVQATAVNEDKIIEQIEKLKAAERNKKQQEDARSNKLKRDAQKAQKKRKLEEKKLAEAKKKREAEIKKQKLLEKLSQI